MAGLKFKAGDIFALHPCDSKRWSGGCLNEMELSISCVPGFKVEPDVVRLPYPVFSSPPPHISAIKKSYS